MGNNTTTTIPLTIEPMNKYLFNILKYAIIFRGTQVAEHSAAQLADTFSTFLSTSSSMNEFTCVYTLNQPGTGCVGISSALTQTFESLNKIIQTNQIAGGTEGCHSRTSNMEDCLE